MTEAEHILASDAKSLCPSRVEPLLFALPLLKQLELKPSVSFAA